MKDEQVYGLQQVQVFWPSKSRKDPLTPLCEQCIPRTENSVELFDIWAIIGKQNS